MNPLLFLPQWLVIAVCGGGNEELGWRGVMQPELETQIPFPVATLLTRATWSLWHVPLWFVHGSSQQSIPFLLFAAFAVVLSFSMAAIQKKTGCVLYSCIFHGLSNTLSSFFIVEGNWILAVGGIVMIAVSILVWYADRGKTVRRT